MTLQGILTSPSGDTPGSWYNLALISETDDGSDSFSMILTGLDMGAHYEVRLRAMNRQGWSPLSESFIFTTAGRQPKKYLEYELIFSIFQIHPSTWIVFHPYQEGS